MLATSHNHQLPLHDAIHVRVGQRIHAARLEAGMTLAELGGDDLSRSFLSAVEHGRAGISLRALAIVAARLKRPMGYFVDEPPDLRVAGDPSVDHVEAAIAYSRLLRSRGETERALEYALWAAQARLARLAPETQSGGISRPAR
jgi:transcriptional regulator with XRE-family HTH domain